VISPDCPAHSANTVSAHSRASDTDWTIFDSTEFSPCRLICVAPKGLDLLALVGDHAGAEQRHLLFEAVERQFQRAQALPGELKERRLGVGIGEHPCGLRADVDVLVALLDVARDNRRRQAREMQPVAIVGIDLVVGDVLVDEVDQRRLVDRIVAARRSR
jgi:hypothetical protein